LSRPRLPENENGSKDGGIMSRRQSGKGEKGERERERRGAASREEKRCEEEMRRRIGEEGQIA
jgi:hypothetical protein